MTVSSTADSRRIGGRPAAAVAFFAAAAVVSWLGIFDDREFGEPYLFLKHRPSATFCFRSPVGESDTPASALPPRERWDEARYREFVEEHGGFRRGILLPWTPCRPA